MKAATDFSPCSYSHFTAGETETLWIVSVPVELHRNVNPCLRPGKESGSVPGFKCCLFCTSSPNSLQAVLGWEIQIQDLAYLTSNFSPCVWIARQKEHAPVQKTHSHPLSLDEAQGKLWSSFVTEGRSSLQVNFHPWYRDFIRRAEQQPLWKLSLLCQTQRTLWKILRCEGEGQEGGQGERSALCLYTNNTPGGKPAGELCQTRWCWGIKDEFLGVVGLRDVQKGFSSQSWVLETLISICWFSELCFIDGAKGISAHFVPLMALGRPLSLLEVVRTQIPVGVEEEQL